MEEQINASSGWKTWIPISKCMCSSTSLLKDLFHWSKTRTIYSNNWVPVINMDLTKSFESTWILSNWSGVNSLPSLTFFPSFSGSLIHRYYNLPHRPGQKHIIRQLRLLQPPPPCMPSGPPGQVFFFEQIWIWPLSCIYWRKIRLVHLVDHSNIIHERWND